VSIPEVVTEFQLVRRALSTTLARLQAGEGIPIPVDVYSDCFRELTHSLATGERCLKMLAVPGFPAAEGLKEIELYREALLRLENVLSEASTNLLCNRASLANDAARLAAVSAWSGISKTTL
jgi:hypothetical protein